MDKIECYSFKNFLELSNDQILMIFEWRNHPIIRKWSFNQKEVILRDHELFIESLRNAPNKKYWLVSRKSIPIGVFSIVNFDKNKGEVGYYIAPEHQSKLYSVGFLYHSLKYLFEEIKIPKLYGYTLVDNKLANSLNNIFGFYNEKTKLEVNQVQTEFIYTEMSLKKWYEDVSTDKTIQKLVTLSDDFE